MAWGRAVLKKGDSVNVRTTMLHGYRRIGGMKSSGKLLEVLRPGDRRIFQGRTYLVRFPDGHQEVYNRADLYHGWRP